MSPPSSLSGNVRLVCYRQKALKLSVEVGPSVFSLRTGTFGAQLGSGHVTELGNLLKRPVFRDGRN